jgi:hypothetical protein
VPPGFSPGIRLKPFSPSTFPSGNLNGQVDPSINPAGFLRGGARSGRFQPETIPNRHRRASIRPEKPAAGVSLEFSVGKGGAC